MELVIFSSGVVYALVVE